MSAFAVLFCRTPEELNRKIKYDSGGTALHEAAEKCSYNCIKLLVEAEAGINNMSNHAGHIDKQQV